MGKIKEINDILLSVLWGKYMIFLIIAVGLIICVRTRFFHITHPLFVLKSTLFLLFKKSSHKKEGKKISPFQSLSTSLASTLGTGNIIGVSSALIVGGEGTIFWMWISALVGMMIKFSENALSVYFRKENSGGAMQYIKEGLKRHCLLNPLSKPLSFLYALFCLLASFGVGNMVQANSMSACLYDAFSISPKVTGIICSILVFLVISGGIHSISKVTEKLVPYMSLLYTSACIFIIFLNCNNILPVLRNIFVKAFDLGSAVGGGVGSIVILGFKRGIFSNEAGLGASSMTYAESSVASPAEAGMWGIFEVFFDTIVSCTLTAFAILCSGVSIVPDAATLINDTFSSAFSSFAAPFIAVMMTLFAFSTIIGWCFYGCKSLEFLSGGKGIFAYKILYSVSCAVGAVMNLSLVWEISDTLNALMAIPNLIALLCLSGIIKKIAKN